MKFYVVWKGFKVGVFRSEEYIKHTKGCKGAIGKRFNTYEDALEALRVGPVMYGITNTLTKDDLREIERVCRELEGDEKEILKSDDEAQSVPSEMKSSLDVHSQIGVNLESAYCVDASRVQEGFSFFSEYRVIRMEDKEVVYQSERFGDVDINLMEFIAVMAAAHYVSVKKIKSAVIFTDSAVALKWIGEKRIKVSLPMEKNIEREVKKAVKIMEKQGLVCPILKWQTQLWGENPADFGRKASC